MRTSIVGAEIGDGNVFCDLPMLYRDQFTGAVSYGDICLIPLAFKSVKFGGRY